MKRGHFAIASIAIIAATIVAYSWQPAQEAAAQATVGCEQACAFRKKCAVPNSDDLTACASGCAKISPLLGPKDLANYVKAGCAKAKDAEAGFTAALVCTIASEHRATCVGTPGAKDTRTFIGACLATYTGPDDLQQYIGAKCDQVKQIEPAMLGGLACVKTCDKVVGCKVKNATAQLCLDNCVAGVVTNKTMTIGDVEAAGKADCKWMHANLKYEKPVSAMEMSIKAGKTGQKCRSTGVDDCPYFSMCCANGAATAGLRSGMCISPAICMFPKG